MMESCFSILLISLAGVGFGATLILSYTAINTMLDILERRLDKRK